MIQVSERINRNITFINKISSKKFKELTSYSCL
nr:MAG TPA: hypothetical protein [Bacteriophage sp.]